jgi:2-polyprenyl-3-methyl-5-hydroxy-6-metoxy-1,4-benzoquinol methylase
MIDCLPYIRKVLEEFPRKTIIDFLDVGAGSGAGANLLATLYRGGFFKGQYKLKIDALDFQKDFEKYAKFYFPEINFIATDFFIKKFDKKYDIVFSSHVIEHQKDPKKFVEKLLSLSKKFVLIYAPYEADLSAEHVSSITPEFAREMGAEFVEIVSSPAWFSPKLDRKCIVFAIKAKHV